MGTVRVTMAVYGLTCGGGGSLAVERTLTGLPGVVRAYVNPATEMAYVEYKDGAAEPGDLVEAVERAGFQAGEVQVRSGVPSATAATVTAPATPAAPVTPITPITPITAATSAQRSPGEDQLERDRARSCCGEGGG